jgi:hypothetical protein
MRRLALALGGKGRKIGGLQLDGFTAAAGRRLVRIGEGEAGA